ncbi:MAG: hypothetical protein G01um101431_753 [Parcubacteria group bacterium Gr01-1014_31]|nr:MAG: hypothetical protein G01um101431_753 [Parcubacteria group bacterium Gr01-1014_31]
MARRHQHRWRLLTTVVFLCLLLAGNSRVRAAETVRDIVFPVSGAYTYSDNFGDPRSNGRTHEGVDILTAKHTPVVAATDARVRYLTIPEASWGYAVYLQDADGYQYRYLHLNNDTPGTDDGNGGPGYAFAPGIVEDAVVARGQVVGFAGDSGNAEQVGAHLHFEIWLPDGNPINPYESLRQSEMAARYRPDEQTAASPTINDDKRLSPPSGTPGCASGTLIKTPEFSAVYYCGADGKRYVFPNDRVYFSWYKDFSGVTTVDAGVLAQLPIGGNVTYRPGVRLVKVQTDPRIYAVARGGELCWVTSPEVAAALYGTNWAKSVDDLPDVFFANYRLGAPVSRVE